MFFHFYRNLIYFVFFFKEVLKFFNLCISRKCSKLKLSFNLVLFPFSLWSDEITYYFFFLFYDLFFFSNLINFNFFFLPHYLFFIFFSFAQTYFGNFIFSFYFFVLFLFGIFLLGYSFLMFSLFIFISLVMNFYDFLFRSKIAGLFLFSRDFLSLEDEDLWICSNMFYFDNRVIESRDFKIPMTSDDIEVFSTIIRMFFDIPLKSSEYYNFSTQLFLFKDDFRKHLDKKRDKGISILDELYSKANSTKRLSAKLSSFFSLFLSKDSLNYSKVNTINFYLRKSLSSKIYYPSFFNFFFHLINFSIPNLKSNKLDKLKEIKLKNQYRKFRKKFFIKKNFTFSKVNSSNLANSLDQRILFERKINNRTNFINVKNRKTFLEQYFSIKDSLEFFSSSRKFSVSAFSYFRNSTLYNELNNKVKLQRFRRFFWISFPFYILEIYNLFNLFFFNSKILVILYSFYKSLLSKFLYVLFWLFGDEFPSDINPLFDYKVSNYNPSVKLQKLNNNFFTFLKTKSPDFQSVSRIFQSFFNFDSYFIKLDEDENDQSRIKKSNNFIISPDSLVDDLQIILDSNSQFTTRTRRILQKLKNEISEEREVRFLNFLNRKSGVVQKQNLVFANKYYFSNKYNSKSSFYHPRIELLDFYKLLEYFYFVLTNDINFYENAQFNAKVEILKQKYGQAIVSDLLDSKDHKQAKKVSVQLHVVDHIEKDQIINVSNTPQSDNVNDTMINDNPSKEEFSIKNSFKSKRKIVSKSKSNVDNFVDDLILSYKYRFKK